MSPNLSMSTGFGLFRNSNFLTSHERVVNSYISVFMYIHLLCFAEDSYQVTSYHLNLVMGNVR